MQKVLEANLVFWKCVWAGDWRSNLREIPKRQKIGASASAAKQIPQSSLSTCSKHANGALASLLYVSLIWKQLDFNKTQVDQFQTLNTRLTFCCCICCCTRCCHCGTFSVILSMICTALLSDACTSSRLGRITIAGIASTMSTRNNGGFPSSSASAAVLKPVLCTRRLIASKESLVPEKRSHFST